jgi:hypothetical protein
MATTEDAKYRFTVKEGQASASGKDDAPTSLMLELSDGKGLSILQDGFLLLRLRPGTSVAEAQEIARYLQDRVTAVSHTRFR